MVLAPVNFEDMVRDDVLVTDKDFETGTETFDPSLMGNNTSISDAKTFGDLDGASVEEKLEWLIDHDSANKTGWIEQLLGLQGNRENLTDARSYELWLQNTKIQRTARDLEAAGINPILAYQYLSGNNSGLGAAGYPDSNVSANETSRRNNAASVAAAYARNDTAKDANAVKIASIIGVLVGIIIKAMI